MFCYNTRVKEKDRMPGDAKRYRNLLLRAWIDSATEKGALLPRLSAELAAVANQLRDKKLAAEVNAVSVHLTGDAKNTQSPETPNQIYRIPLSEHEDLTYNPATQTAISPLLPEGKREVQLAKMEGNALEALAKKPTDLLPWQDILKAMWEFPNLSPLPADYKIVNSCITQIRRKLGDVRKDSESKPQYRIIHNWFGKGFSLADQHAIIESIHQTAEVIPDHPTEVEEPIQTMTACGILDIYPKSGFVVSPLREGEKIAVTKQEMSFLQMLAERPRIPVRPNDFNDEMTDGAFYVLMHRIRTKLGDVSPQRKYKLIKFRFGGYSFVLPPSSSHGHERVVFEARSPATK